MREGEYDYIHQFRERVGEIPFPIAKASVLATFLLYLDFFSL